MFTCKCFATTEGLTALNKNTWGVCFNSWARLKGRKAFFYYSGDQKTEHSNNGTIWLMDYWKFVIQVISQATYQTAHDPNNEHLVHYSGHGLNEEPFYERTILDHLNTKLICYSDTHCIKIITDFGCLEFGLLTFSHILCRISFPQMGQRKILFWLGWILKKWNVILLRGKTE